MEASKVIRKAYDQVREFNDIAGNLTNVTDESVDAQISFCFEEVAEVITAFEEGDRPEILKEACDLFVVTAGLLQKLEAQGYDVATALVRVNDNNLSKFPAVGELFGHPIGCTTTLNEKYNRLVIKDGVGKVRKPSNYCKPYMTDLIPKRGV